MKIVKCDADKKEQEKIASEIKNKKDLVRDSYIEELRRNKRFQDYVIDGIIKKNIDQLTDLRNIPNADFNNLEEVGKIVMQTKMARTVLEKILSELIN